MANPINVSGVFCAILLIVIVAGLIVWLLYKALTEDKLIREGRQENDVWNISGRVNSQSMESWPTHDHHISIDSFAFPPDYQAKDPRFAPPPYTEVDLPTYDEAMTACANNKATTQQPAPVHGVMTRSETA